MAIGVKPLSYEEDPYVGFSSQIPLFISNEGNEELLVTARNKLAYFNKQEFSRTKPENTTRVFCLGGSTTYGRPYDDTTSFCGWLRKFLPAADPDRKWELINEPTPGHIDDDRMWREEEVLTPRLCMLMFETGCERHPQLLGLFDDSSQAYQDYHVGTNETRCLQRSKDYWEWCGNSLAQLVVAFFVPSGSELAHPFATTDE